MSSLRSSLARVPGLKPVYRWLRAFYRLGANATQLTEASAELAHASARLSTLDRDFRSRPEADIPVEPSLALRVESSSPVLVADEARRHDAVYVAFEDEFYDTDIVSQKQTVYVPYLRATQAEHGVGRVVDLGCGRGEFLRILRASDIEASGVEINQQEVEDLRQQGFAVSLCDANEYLAGCDDASLAAVVALQVVEHVDVEYLKKLLNLVARKLRPAGSTFIVETPNPKCLAVHGAFFNDLTHVRLYPADTLRFYLSQLGFTSFDIVYTSPCAVEYRIPGASECNYQDYGLVARR